MSLPPIRSKLADDPDYAELVAEFVSNVPLRIQSIRKSMEQNDIKQLGTLIHQLKGACGGYGFHELTPQATKLEEQLRSGATMIELTESLEEFLETCQRMTTDRV